MAIRPVPAGSYPPPHRSIACVMRHSGRVDDLPAVGRPAPGDAVRELPLVAAVSFTTKTLPGRRPQAGAAALARRQEPVEGIAGAPGDADVRRWWPALGEVAGRAARTVALRRSADVDRSARARPRPAAAFAEVAGPIRTRRR